MNTESKITAVLDTDDWEENGKNAEPQTEFLIEDKITIIGFKLHFDISDEEQGLFFIGKQGYIRATNVFINKDDEICVEIPEELKTDSYLIQICRKKQEDAGLDTVTYEKPIKILGFLDVYRMTKEDYYFNDGLEHGIKRGRKELIKELEERGIKVPEDLKPQKTIVIKKKDPTLEGVTQVQVKQVPTV